MQHTRGIASRRAGLYRVASAVTCGFAEGLPFRFQISDVQYAAGVPAGDLSGRDVSSHQVPEASRMQQPQGRRFSGPTAVRPPHNSALPSATRCDHVLPLVTSLRSSRGGRCRGERGVMPGLDGGVAAPWLTPSLRQRPASRPSCSWSSARPRQRRLPAAAAALLLLWFAAVLPATATGLNPFGIFSKKQGVSRCGHEHNEDEYRVANARIASIKAQVCRTGLASQHRPANEAALDARVGTMPFVQLRHLRMRDEVTSPSSSSLKHPMRRAP